MIDGGRIIIPTAADRPPKNLFAARATYTISALDGGDRARRFANVTLDPDATLSRESYVFA